MSSAEDTGSVLVAVVMPVYNAARFLRQAVDSVLSQSHRRFELVAIDDGSTDDSFEILQEYARADSRIRAFRNPRNLGIVETRNRAFREASPEAPFFAVFDSDDVCLADRLERQLEFLRSHPQHAVVGGNTIIIDEHGREVGRRIYPSEHEDIVRVLTRYNPIAQPTVMIRRSALEAVGPYRERFPRCQDYDLWMRMAARFKVANLPAFTLRYRLSSSQGKALHLRASLRYTLEIQREWLFHPAFFNPVNVLYWTAEHGLMLLPDSWILAAFKRLTYRRSRS